MQSTLTAVVGKASVRSLPYTKQPMHQLLQPSVGLSWITIEDLVAKI